MTENSSFTCLLPSRDYQEYEGSVFVNTRAIEIGHERPHRYGHTKNLTQMMVGTEHDESDYMKGLVATDITIFLVFFAWTVALLIGKCLGPSSKCKGFSGQMPTLPPPPKERMYDDSNHYKQEMNQWNYVHQQKSRRLKFARFSVYVAGLCLIVSASCMASFGVESLVDIVDSGIDTLDIVQNLTQGAINLFDDVLYENALTEEDIHIFLQETNGMCPAIREGICKNISDISTCDWADLDFLNGKLLGDFVEHLLMWHEDFQGKIERSQSDLKDALEATDDLQEKALSYSWAFQAARVFGLMSSCLVLAILWGITFRRSKALTCLRHWILLPIFSLLVTLCFAFSMVFIFGSTALADLCINDGSVQVDDRMLILLERVRNSLEPLLYKFMVFYVNQCPLDQVPLGYDTQIDSLLLAVDFLSDLVQSWLDYADQIIDFCGLEQPPDSLQIAEATQLQLCKLVNVLVNLKQYLGCQNWYPLYSSIVYDTICVNGTNGFVWVATCQFVIVLCSMVILTARCAFYDLTIGELDDLSLEITDADPASTYNVDHLQEGAVVPRTVLLTGEYMDQKIFSETATHTGTGPASTHNIGDMQEGAAAPPTAVMQCS